MAAANSDAELYYLLAAMIATDTITFEQGKQWADFRTEAKVQYPVPVSLEAAVDMALDYFHEDPDTEAAHEAQRVAEACEAPHGHCVECGEALDPVDMVTDTDFEMAMDIWLHARDLVRIRDEIEIEEC